MIRQKHLFPDAVPNRTDSARDKLDRYYTPAHCTHSLLQFIQPNGMIWEPCAGKGHIAKVLRKRIPTANIFASDVDGPYCHMDFLDRAAHPTERPDWIITNPPYSTPLCRASDFVRQALETQPRVGIAMLLPITFWEGCNDRRDLLRDHPPHICIHLGRVNFIRPEGKGSPPGDSQWWIWYTKLKTKQTSHVYP